MGKELEALVCLKRARTDIERGNCEYNVTDYLDTIETALKRLESIDNSNPSEALKDLERIGSDYFLGSKDCLVKKIYEKEYNNIKQVLLKAQEPKQYLKWEDLEFKDYEQEISVLLNGNKYSVKYTLLPDDDFYRVWIYKEDKCIFSLDGKYAEDKQFFNDSHLERVLE